MFCIFEKNSKIQNGRHFWRVKYSLRLGKASLIRYPVGQKFCQNRFISHGFRDLAFLVLRVLKKNSKVQNGYHFWRVKYLLKLGKASLHTYPVGQNPTSKFLFYEENGFKSIHISHILT